jgi:hypothetical protein
MMTTAEIAGLRFTLQQISDTRFTTPGELVAWMGAMQAQDYRMSKWAIGMRLPGIMNEAVEQAIDKGEIVRTHVLRPTWHLVAAKDIRWMLSLTAPHINAASAAQRRSLGIDEQLLTRTTDIIIKALSGGRQLTREELMQEIRKTGIVTDTHRAVHIMFDAELKAIVCNGTMRGPKLTYRLMDEIIPPGDIYNREEALHQLALRYFSSHGPATVQDFQWWSGLPAGDTRKALEMIKKDMVCIKSDQKEYWVPRETVFLSKNIPEVCFLPAFDEFLVSYKDRTAVLHPDWHREAITINGIFKPSILVEGKVAGTWKHTVKKNKLQIETGYFDPAMSLDAAVIDRALERLNDFWERR